MKALITFFGFICVLLGMTFHLHRYYIFNIRGININMIFFGEFDLIQIQHHSNATILHENNCFVFLLYSVVSLVSWINCLCFISLWEWHPAEPSKLRGCFSIMQ